MDPNGASILVVGADRARAAIIMAGLREAGHDRIHLVDEESRAARTIETLVPDAVVADVGTPDAGRLAQFFALGRSIGRPLVIFVDSADGATIEAAVAAGVAAFVVDGLRKERVKPILDTAISRFNNLARLSQELDAARLRLEDRKVIDQAKGILMQSKGLAEADAYALLRRAAMDQNRRLAEVARSVVSASSLLGS